MLFRSEELHLIHYNLSFKPWHFDNILYEEYFWKYAKETEYFEEIQSIKANYTDKQRAEDLETGDRLLALAQKESDCVGDDRKYRR